MRVAIFGSGLNGALIDVRPDLQKMRSEAANVGGSLQRRGDIDVLLGILTMVVQFAGHDLAAFVVSPLRVSEI